MNSVIKKVVKGALLCAMVVLLGGTVFSKGFEKYPYKIETTIGMVFDIVKEVAGDKATVSHIVGTGVDPHLYGPTTKDIKRLLSADVVFYSGLMLEGKMSDALIKVARKKPIFAVTELLDEKFLLSPEEFAGHHDPHVWMDVTGWSKAVDVVVASLSEVDPANKSVYVTNAKAYQAKLVKLHEYAKKAISTIPEKSRVLITAHDAFNYFGRAYGFEVMGIQGLSTESEAGLEDIRKLVETISVRKVKAIFNESSVPSKNVKALQEGCKAKGHSVIIGGELFSDAMGATGTYEGTYIGMIDHNVTTIVRALGGQAPKAGLNGKLTHVK